MGVNNSLLKSMQTIVDKAIEVAPFDKTRQAQVITNNADGTYTIRLDGILYNNVPSYPQTSSISAGSVVKIITPSNQPSQMFIQSLKGGGGGDHVELTQSQYNALTPSQKTDGTVYFVTDGDSECFIMSDSVPIGAIQAFGGRVAPEGWLICDGSAISREDYIDLFTAIGTTYGDGDGNTTFNIPDFSGRTAIGMSATYILGDADGEETHTLTVDEMPSHSHTNLYHTSSGTGWGYNYQNIGQRSQPTESSGGIGNTGGNQPHNNMQPYIVINYIIKAFQPPTDNVIKSLDPDRLLLDAFYPVGSEYSTINSAFNPNITWGGTWTSEEMSEDYIVEEGTSGIWTYRKWSSGISECWGKHSATLSHYASVMGGNAYTTGEIALPNAVFNSAPIISYSARVGGNIALTGTISGTFTASAITLYALSNASGSRYTEWLVNAEGLWKTYEAPKTVYKWTRTV